MSPSGEDVVDRRPVRSSSGAADGRGADRLRRSGPGRSRSPCRSRPRAARRPGPGPPPGTSVTGSMSPHRSRRPALVQVGWTVNESGAILPPPAPLHGLLQLDRTDRVGDADLATLGRRHLCAASVVVEARRRSRPCSTRPGSRVAAIGRGGGGLGLERPACSPGRRGRSAKSSRRETVQARDRRRGRRSPVERQPSHPAGQGARGGRGQLGARVGRRRVEQVVDRGPGPGRRRPARGCRPTSASTPMSRGRVTITPVSPTCGKSPPTSPGRGAGCRCW